MKFNFCLSLLITIVILAFSADGFGEAVIDTSFGSGADATIANDESDGGAQTNQFFADDALGEFNDVSMRMFVDDLFLTTVRHRVGLFRFDLTGLSGDFTDAHFEFHSTNQGRTVDFFVLNDSDEATESWDEATITYNSAPGLLGPQPYPTNYVSLDPAAVTEIGSWAIPGPNSGGGFPVNFTVVSRPTPAGGAQPGKVYADTIAPEFSMNLAAAIEADTNDLLTVMMILTGADDPAYGGNNGNVSIVSKEGLIADMEAEMPVGFFFNPSLVLPNAVLEEPEGLPGDYNDNGIVDAADYSVWRDNVGAPGPLLNDSLSGPIGQPHYDQWKTNFGMSESAGSLMSAAVPEPSAIALAATALGLVLAACRRTRSFKT